MEPDLSAEGTAGKWDVVAGAYLVWVSRAGQETGPGSNLVGKMEAVLWCKAEGRASTRSLELESDSFGSEEKVLSVELQPEAELSEQTTGSNLPELLLEPGSEAGSWPGSG